MRVIFDQAVQRGLVLEPDWSQQPPASAVVTPNRWHLLNVFRREALAEY